jgi:hypothetical protein
MGNLTKRDLLWVAIRVFGVYLLVEAFMAIPTAGIGLFYIALTSIIHPDAPSLVREASAEKGVSYLSTAVLQIAAYGAGGFYLLTRGDWLLRLAGADRAES